jgi:hypothetical protein
MLVLQSLPSAKADGKMFGVICVFSHIDVINLKKRLKPFELHPLIRQLQLTAMELKLMVICLINYVN